MVGIRGLELIITKFKPLEGKGYTPLPFVLKAKKAIINMKNKDDQCFKWAVTRALNAVEDNPLRVTDKLREQAQTYNWDATKFPTKVKDIHLWEVDNDVNVNVFGFDEDKKKVYTIKLGYFNERRDESVSRTPISLFLNGENHYCVISDLSRLVRAQLSKTYEYQHAI